MGARVELLTHDPIVTAAHVGNSLGTTPRTGLNLPVEPEDHGLVEDLVRRMIYRAWAPSPLAAHILGDVRARSGRRPGVEALPRSSLEAAPRRRDRIAEDDALADLDNAMEKANKILRK